MTKTDQNQKIGVLLINLGTPDAPDTESVRRYLGEFLMDPYVLDMPWIFRALLVKGIILNTRPKKSAAAYQKVWTSRGSPLAFHTIDLASKVQETLGEKYVVKPVMRYGRPTVADALRSFQSEGIQSVVALPLYPQYASASSESSIQWVRSQAKKLSYPGELRFVGAFYRDEKFLDAFAERVRETRAEFSEDRVLFSFHGLPERAVKKLDKSGGQHCLAAENCCAVISDVNANCYRAQCYYTARKIAEKVGIAADRYQVTFQSRLGPTKWIQPYSDIVLTDLAQSGAAKKILMISPSFVADCLETLEEIAIRSKEDFIAAGGEDLKMVPSLNSNPTWVKCVADLVVNV